MKKHIALLASAALVLANTAAFAADTKRDDASITQDAKTKINGDTSVPTANSPAIVIEVKDSKVILTGTVDTKDQKENAEKSAKAVDGVKKVDNKLQVKGD